MVRKKARPRDTYFPISLCVNLPGMIAGIERLLYLVANIVHHEFWLKIGFFGLNRYHPLGAAYSLLVIKRTVGKVARFGAVGILFRLSSWAFYTAILVWNLVGWYIGYTIWEKQEDDSLLAMFCRGAVSHYLHGNFDLGRTFKGRTNILRETHLP